MEEGRYYQNEDGRIYKCVREWIDYVWTGEDGIPYSMYDGEDVSTGEIIDLYDEDDYEDVTELYTTPMAKVLMGDK